MKLITIVSFLILLICFSCSNFEYQGEWKGTYSGKSDNGHWTAKINKNGIVSGEARSSVFNVTFKLTGNVNSNGQFLASYGNKKLKGVFNGLLEKNIAEGTWSVPYLDVIGKFKGNKE